MERTTATLSTGVPGGTEERSKARTPRRRAPASVLPAKKNGPAPLLMLPVGLSYKVLSRFDSRTSVRADPWSGNIATARTPGIRRRCNLELLFTIVFYVSLPRAGVVLQHDVAQ